MKLEDFLFKDSVREGAEINATGRNGSAECGARNGRPQKRYPPRHARETADGPPEGPD